MRSTPASCLALLLCAAAAHPTVAAADATRVIIRGAGFGHGVGMSQYGAYGFALRGVDHPAILRHYYRGTELRTLSTEPTVRVLLQTARTVTVSGVTQVAGGRRLDPAASYRVAGFADELVLRDDRGRSLGRYGAPLRLTGAADGLQLGGTALNGVRDGRYRGDLELRPGSFGVSAINAVGLETYVRGVISSESPASWPGAALRAQAIVARTYAITTNKPGVGFDHYPDVRSQVYTGIRAEYPSTDAAVSATTRQVVTHQGQPVVTYFFSTSGGRTENVENSFIGADPKPWLRSVEDPYDNASPKHRWGPLRWTGAQAQRRFGGWVKGRLRSVEVVRRGASPRIVAADIVGTRGRTRVTGPQIRARLGLNDTWVTFRVITTGARPARPAEPPRPGSGAAGGAAPRSFGLRVAPRAPRAVLTGTVASAPAGGWVRVERRTGGSWAPELDEPVDAAGRYRAPVRRPGLYRVRAGRDAGPAVRVR